MDCFDYLDNQGDRGIFPGMEILHSQPQLYTTLFCEPALKSFKVNLAIKLLVHNRPFIMRCEMKFKFIFFVAKTRQCNIFGKGRNASQKIIMLIFGHYQNSHYPNYPPSPKWFKISKFNQKNTSKVFWLGHIFLRPGFPNQHFPC